MPHIFLQTLRTAARFNECYRLRPKTWWENYYDPLRKNIMALKHTHDEVMQAVIHETEEEMTFFKAHHTDYGYTYYIMKAV